MTLTFNSLADVVSKRFRIDSSKIEPQSTFEELGLDSLSQIELVMTLKKDLQIHLTDDQVAQMSSLSDILSEVNNTRDI